MLSTDLRNWHLWWGVSWATQPLTLCAVMLIFFFVGLPTTWIVSIALKYTMTRSSDVHAGYRAGWSYAWPKGNIILFVLFFSRCNLPVHLWPESLIPSRSCLFPHVWLTPKNTFGLFTFVLQQQSLQIVHVDWPHYLLTGTLLPDNNKNEGFCSMISNPCGDGVYE
jgi:hypothetical protein